VLGMDLREPVEKYKGMLKHATIEIKK
jgi:hypothetical protein